MGKKEIETKVILFSVIMIEYHNDILGIEVRWLAGTQDNPNAGQVITYWQYKRYVRSGKIEVIRKAHGKGRTD